MMERATFISAGWDFVDETANGWKDIWRIDDGLDYPRLWWENRAPIADAGEDQVVYARTDAAEMVTLDGSGSYDEDGDEMTYAWKWAVDGNEFQASGEKPCIELPVGEYVVKLVVSDGNDESEPNYVKVTVVPAIACQMKFTPEALNLESKGKWVKAHFVLPEGYRAEDVNVNEPAELLPVAVKSESMKVFINDAGQVEVEASFARQGLCNRGSFDGDVTAVGRLRSGQYFYGRDSVKVIDRRMERVGLMAMYWLEHCSGPDYCGGFDSNEDGVVNFADFAQVGGCCEVIIEE
jgi:hypothetical protein